MTQSMISVVVGLVVLLAVAWMLMKNYMLNHEGEAMTQWLDAHHMAWMHHKH